MHTRLIRVLVILAIATPSGTAGLAAQGCENIEWRSPTPFGYSLNDVVFGDGIFLAPAGSNHVAVSSDGESWTLHRVADFEVGLGSAYWDGSRFIINSTSGRVFTSPDGDEWTQHDVYGYAPITAVVTSGTRTVVSDLDGTLVTSTDWLSWSVVYYSPHDINALAASSSEFIAVGDATTILRSTDGMNWSDVSPSYPAGVELHDVQWNGSQFVAVGVGGTTFQSPDGLIWQDSDVGFAVWFNSLAWDGSRWVVMGSVPLRVYSSTDGSWWSFEAEIDADQLTRGIAFGNGAYVIVGDRGVNLKSTDRSTWIPHCSGPYDHLKGVATNGGRLVAVGESGTTLSSAEGREWSAHPLPLAIDLYGVVWSGTEFLAVGESGAVWASPDGGSWTDRPIAGVSDTLYGIVSATALVAVGEAGTIVTSLDGSTWSPAASAASVDLHAVTSNENIYVAIGDGGTIVTSPDAISWTQRTSGTSRDLRTVLWDGSSFYATGHNGDVVVSSDGITWTDGAPLTYPTGNTTYDLGFLLGTYVAANSSKGIMTSPDMTTWSDSPEWDTSYALAPSRTGLVAVGLHGSIIGLECWGIVFTDGFETGSTGNWSAATPD
jgi:hypothetical protein